jgi:CRP/FNR family transcriptional regulator, nitrogen oxide reductase regulator
MHIGRMELDSLSPEVLESPLLRGLSPSELERVFSRATLRKLKKGQVLFRQDEPAKTTYVVLSGRIKMQQVSVDGAQTLLRVLKAGQILAVVATVREEGGYPATAVAERDTTVVGWNGKALDQLFLEVPRLCRNALGILSGRIGEMQSRFAELAAERTERRLASALLRLVSQVGKKEKVGVSLDLDLTRQDLAEMIGTTLFSVSRILSDWKAKGWVKLGRQRVHLTDPHAIVRIAEEESPSGAP